MDRAPRIRIMILVLLLVSGLAIAGCSSGTTPGQAPRVGNMAPDFQLPDLEGRTVSLSDFHGMPVLLNFWATWCGPCRAEMPFIQDVFEDKKFSEKGLVILAVNLGESRSKVEQFMETYGLSFEVLLDTSQDVGQAYNIRGIPTTFFIDKDGIIKDIKIGAFSNTEEIEWRLVNSILDDE